MIVAIVIVGLLFIWITGRVFEANGHSVYWWDNDWWHEEFDND